jgi:hypothetical protein
MANRYWVGGTGTWNGGSTANWSTESGGSSGASVPLATDNVFFDALSGGGTVTVLDNVPGNPPECANLICTGFTGTLDSSNAPLNVNGNITLSTGGDYTSLQVVIISGTVCTLTSVGKSISQTDVESAATVSLADAVNAINGIYNSGTFTTNNFNVTVGQVYIAGTANMGSSTFTVNGNWQVDVGSTVNAGTSTINLTNTSVIFDGGDKTYYNLNIGASIDLSGDNTFNTISNSAQPITIQFDSGSTQTVTNFAMSGTAGNLVTLRGQQTSPRWILSKASGTVSSDYLSIRNSDATGGAAWYAGANSTNLISIPQNQGWIFTAPPAPVGQTVTIGAGIILGPGVSIT